MENSKTYLFFNGSNENNLNNNENLIYSNKINSNLFSSETNNELLKRIDYLSKKNQEKDIQILTLKTDVNSLATDKSCLNNKIIKMNKQIQQLILELDNLNKELNKKKLLKTNLNDLNNPNGNNSQFQLNNLKNKILNLQSKLSEKDNKIFEYQNMILDLKNDNNKIFANSEKKSNNYEKLLSNVKNNYSSGIEKRDNYINELNIKLSYDKDYNNLINYIIDQISNIGNLIEKNDLESFNNNNLKNDDLKNKNFEIFPKFELINKNFQNLIKKIYEIRLNDKEELKKSIEIINNEKQKNLILEKKLKNEKTERISERNDILGMDEVIKENSSEIQRLNNTITNIINKTDELENENKLLLTQYNQFKQKINELCDENINIYFDFINNNFKKENFPFTSLPNFSYNNEPHIKLQNINLSLKTLLSYLNNINIKDNQNLNESFNLNINNDINNIIKNPINLSQINDNNINNLNQNMENKIFEFSQLLLESNKCLAKSNIENSELIKKNRLLESQLNNDINNLNKDKFDDNIINDLKHEIEIKNFQIKSLEKLINQLNKNPNHESYIGKIISNKKINEFNLNKVNNKFIENDKNERELNNLLNKLNKENYNSDNSLSDSFISNENNMNNNFFLRNNINKKI